MKKMTFNPTYYILALMLGIGFFANAQKLPNVQPAAIRAPQNIKIDGKATEINNQFQAYNHAADLFYTMANDDDNLYLTIQANDARIARRVLAGGITLTINPSGKKTDANKMAITYPLYDANKKPNIRDVRSFEMVEHVTLTDKQVDSLMRINDKKVRDFAKTIRVAGIKTIDTLISVYNEDGIKASSGIGPKLVYTYELAISLKKLGLNINKAAPFAYNIRINATESKGITTTIDQNGNTVMHITSGSQTAQEATDFWGEYTLIK